MLVSVIIPNFNRERYIVTAVSSVLKQTYKDIEVIVVDDFSSDRSLDVLHTIKDSRLRIIPLQKNGGACRARNKGIQAARGDLIAFLDSDDTWKSNKIEKQVEFLCDNDYDVVFSRFRYHELSGISSVIPDDFRMSKPLLKTLLTTNVITTGTVLGKANVFKENLFDENLSRFQDWDIVLRLVQKFRCGMDKRILVDIYENSTSITHGTNANKSVRSLKIITDKNFNVYSNNPREFQAIRWRIVSMEIEAGIIRSEKIKFILSVLSFNILLWVAFVFKIGRRLIQVVRNKT